MKLIPSLEVPCFSDKPLCGETDWLAIPVHLSCKSTSYKAALSKIKDVNDKLHTVCEQASGDLCRFIPLPSDSDDYQDLEPSLELAKQNGDCIVSMNNNIVIELTSGARFWQKMASITAFLDEVHQFCEQFRNDKYLDIKFGSNNLEKFTASSI